MTCPTCAGLEGAHAFGCTVPRELLGWSAKSLLRRRTEETRRAIAAGTFRRQDLDPRQRELLASGSSKSLLPGGPHVINRHHYRGKRMPEPWLYIGRNDRQPEKASPLRNPFGVREHGAKALELYRDHLRRLVEDDDSVTLAELRKITADTHLVCSCAPRPCHGDVVVEVWRELFGSDRARSL